MNRIHCGAILCTFALAACLGRAATITWNNTAGGNWSNPNNWTPNQVPGASDDALLTGAGTYTVVVDLGQTVSNLTVGGSSGLVTLSVPSAGLTINNSASFTTKGSLSLTGGTVSGSGSINFAGSNYWSSGVFNNSGGNTVIASGSFLLDTSGNHDWPGTIWTNAGTFTHSSLGQS